MTQSTGFGVSHRLPSLLHEGHTATLLPSGKVLVAGGWNRATTLASAEISRPGFHRLVSYRLYGPPSGPPIQPPSCPTARFWWLGACMPLFLQSSAELYEPGHADLVHPLAP